MAEPVLILVAVSSVIGSLVYLFKNIKKCKGPCCECYQNTDHRTETSSEEQDAVKTSRMHRLISSLTPRRDKKPKITPVAFMP